jgi:histidinol-phosphate phosphatase family protein
VLSPTYDVVVPTVGRPCLIGLLDALAAQNLDGRVVVVDDRPDRSAPLLPQGPPPGLALEVRAGRAAGPAAARNIGWWATTADWVAFLDDDVVPATDWADRLAEDLASCGPEVGASQGRLRVPLPAHRRPTDWERNVSGLERARWATANMAYRRAALERVGGFDERFPRAYREDADLGLRVVADGWRIVDGRRSVDHPVRPAPWHVSVGKQAGNADDALMDRLHGRDWRPRAGAPVGRRRRHLAIALAALLGLGAAVARRPRLAAVGGGAWLLGSVELAWRRIAPGPRTLGEVAAMAATSLVLPFAATGSWLAGRRRARLLTTAGHDHLGGREPPALDAVLFDRDGTLVVDVPYNGDPRAVVAVPGAREALDRLREAGRRVALVSNQSGVAQGLVTEREVAAVNDRVSERLGPFAAVLVCPHGPTEGCDCRKPQPGLVLKAAAELGVEPDRCAMVGDIGSDVDAALAAGAHPILVPTRVTRAEEVAAAPTVAADLADAVRLILGEEPWENGPVAAMGRSA